jgi:antitoxin component YwqK of YwqJK toxin-antitoxin module
MFSCTSEQGEKNNEVDISQSKNNKYNSNETYYYGGLVLVTETNLPLTGFRLDYDTKEGYLSSEAYYINGRENGSYKRYYKDGSISSETSYVNGKKDGWDYSYFGNGRKHYETPYQNGEIDGRSISWFENGQIKEISHYENGLRIGWQRAFLENGAILYEVNLVNGNGEIAYVDAELSIQFKTKYVGGKEVTPISGKVYEGVGTSRILNIYHESSYHNGERNGLMKRFYKDRPKQRPSEINYKYGMRHGFTKYWFENGNVESQEGYYFGELDGLCQYWHENGQLEREVKYDRGILVSKKCWDESGKNIECDCYNNKGDKIKCP